MKYISSYVLNILKQSTTHTYNTKASLILIDMITSILYVTWHEKTGLMYTKYTHSYKTEYLHCCTSYLQSASCIRLCRNDSISGDKFVKIPCLHKKVFNFEIQKCGQTLCAHKTHFLMPGHIY